MVDTAFITIKHLRIFDIMKNLYIIKDIGVKMIPYEIIKKKREGEELTEEEIKYFVKGYTDGILPDYQMSALLMALFLKGMSEREILTLTQTMINTGKVLDFSEYGFPVLDKHSTGGVGDKVSIALAPIVASFDILVPMISGRGLGHTGGTLDKLESIPGFNTSLSIEKMYELARKIGFFMGGQTEEFVPADRKLYALRSATATVESIPLISASIMSKKMSEGLDGLVLDVKTGNGAFMKKIEDSEKLAEIMIKIGKGMKRKVVAYITDMNRPLGNKCGNSIEVIEAIDLLKNRGPEDLRKIVYTLSAEMLLIARKEDNFDEAYKKIEEMVNTGKPLEKLERLIEEQNGNPGVVYDYSLLPSAPISFALKAWTSGFISYMDTYSIGMSIVELGGGRKKKDDKIDHGVGIEFYKKTGDKVEVNDPIAVIYARDEDSLSIVLKRLKEAIKIGDNPANMKLIYKRIE